MSSRLKSIIHGNGSNLPRKIGPGLNRPYAKFMLNALISYQNIKAEK